MFCLFRLAERLLNQIQIQFSNNWPQLEQSRHVRGPPESHASGGA